jgi:hypothetical protein
MKSINLRNTKKVRIIFNLIIVALALIFLFLNLDVFYVSHASSGMIPVVTFETYSSLSTSFIYILILLVGVKLYFYLTKRLKKWESLRIFIISLLSIIPIIILMLIVVNPHLLILFPVANAPTRIIEIFFGLIFIIVLYIAFFTSCILIIQQNKYLTKYLIILSSFIGALLISHAIHEFGHALFAVISGGQIVEFYPFPIFRDGILRTGYVTYQNVPSALVPLVTLGGEILQWITIITIPIVLFRVRTPKILTIFLSTLLISSWLDFPLYTINNALGLPHWFVIGCSHGDIMNFIVQTGFPLWAMLFLAFLQLFIGVILLYYKALKRYVSAKIHNKQKSIPLIT